MIIPDGRVFQIPRDQRALVYNVFREFPLLWGVRVLGTNLHLYNPTSSPCICVLWMKEIDLSCNDVSLMTQQKVSLFLRQRAAPSGLLYFSFRKNHQGPPIARLPL